MDLSALGIIPGDLLEISISGKIAYYMGQTPQEPFSVMGLFSSSDSLLGQAELHRVPGAINSGVAPHLTLNTLFGNEPTDIPEDFQIFPLTGFQIQVPSGAKYLFLAVEDSYWADNSGTLAATLNGANPLTVECHTIFTDPGATANDPCASSLAASVAGTVDPNTPGTYTLTYTATDPSGNAAAPVTRTVKVMDTTAPVITLNGASPLTVECHTSFTDPGATANDAWAGSFAARAAGSVDPNTPGTYTLTYTASDPSGNAATPVTRTVKVVDSTAPVITLTGANPLTVECHSSFTDPGARANDTCAGSFAATAAGRVDANTPGTYVLTYTASDPSGNAALPVTRTVIVKDTLQPAIACPADISVGCSVDPLVPVIFAATATDNCDSSPVITYSPAPGSGFPVGTTIVTCTARDASGNESSCTFNVTRAPLAFTGFLAPIGGADATGGSYASPVRTFNMGSTIPVKFTAACGGSQVLSGIHRLQVVPYTSAAPAGNPIDATPQDSATTGDQFRLSDGQWMFNLDTKATGMGGGIWLLRATLSDGSQHSAWIQLK